MRQCGIQGSHSELLCRQSRGLDMQEDNRQWDVTGSPANQVEESLQGVQREARERGFRKGYLPSPGWGAEYTATVHSLFVSGIARPRQGSRRLARSVWDALSTEAASPEKAGPHAAGSQAPSGRNFTTRLPEQRQPRDCQETARTPLRGQGLGTKTPQG